MTTDTTILQVHIMSCFGRHEAHCGDAVGYSHVSRTDALQNLLSDETQYHATHPYDWPVVGSPLHTKTLMLRGVL